MTLKPYQKYKNSDIEWLGDIPEHWEVKRVKDVFYESSERSIEGNEPLLTVSHLTGVTLRSEKNVNMFLAETMAGYKICQKGDLLINTMWAWMGALGASSYYGICSPAYGVYRGRKNVPYNSSYFDYLFKTPNFITEMTRYSKGIVASRLRLYPTNFYQIKTNLPPLSEQTKIANYLDQKTTAIDKKINLLQAKIKQYQALKKSLINETVCRGLDKSVSMKDSGVEWIGEIPKHWEVKRTKDFTSVNMGQSPNSESFNTDKKGIPFYQGKTDFGKLNPIRRMYCNEPKKIANKNDILISVRAPVGDINMANEKCCIGRGLAAISVTKGNLKYFYYQLMVIRQEFRLYITGSTFEAINSNHLTILKATFPPKPEQIQIANYLDEKTGKIDSIVNNLKQQIKRLKELRKVLINDVVTGKLRIRNEK